MSIWESCGYTPPDPLNVKVVDDCQPPCSARLYAVICERFVPSKALRAWVDLDAPLRTMSHAAWRDVFMLERESTAGQRYRYAGGSPCPWCGGALPEPQWDDLDEGGGEGSEA